MDWSWLLPPRCVCCTRRLPGLAAQRLIPAACIRCQPILRSSVSNFAPSIKKIVTAFEYDGDAAFLVKAAKYQPHAPLLTQLGTVLADQSECLKEHDIEAVLAAPSHPKLLARRGLNPARLLAQPLARAWGVPLWEPFRRTSGRAPQAQLSWRERQRSAARSVWCTRNLPARVLIVDDVVTSGSTLLTLANLARTCGATEVFAAVLCRSPRCSVPF